MVPNGILHLLRMFGPWRNLEFMFCALEDTPVTNSEDIPGAWAWSLIGGLLSAVITGTAEGIADDWLVLLGKEICAGMLHCTTEDSADFSIHPKETL